MPRALVTGAAGFIGSHLCEKLSSLGLSVIGVDNCLTGREENLKSLQGNPDFQFVKAPIEDALFLISSTEFDYVFHLAARADIVPSIKDPFSYFDTNVRQTVQLLEAFRDRPIKKFVYAASSSCYGIPDFDQYPTSEICEIKCEYPYALTKYMGEQAVLHWAKVFKIPALSLRLFNVYGPRARTSGDYGAMFGVFLSQIANGQPITIVGDGTQTRDFTFVSDVCDAFYRASQSQFNQQIFNIGSGGTYSVNQIADLLGAKDRIMIPKRPGEPGITYANITKAKDLLGYSPKVSIEQGCKIMKTHLSDFKEAPLWTPETIKEQTKAWFDYLGG